MSYEETLNHICNKFDADPDKKELQGILCSRFTDIPELFHELGFKEGAEIGVLKGEYTKILCDAGFKMHGIDAWSFYHTYRDFRKQHQLDEFERIARKTLWDSDCKIYKGWSDDIVDHFEDKSLDFVFIDGNHDFRHTTNDIDRWSRKVKPGGIVYGHDFQNYNNSNFMHVKNVVPAYCDAYKLKPYFKLKNKGHITCWMFVRPETFNYNA
jgi:SAM-dependent methyltransferase